MEDSVSLLFYRRLNESVNSVRKTNIFAGLSAWFSESVSPEVIAKWKNNGGTIEASDKAQFLFSEDAESMDTIRFYKSQDHLNQLLTVFHPSCISKCITEGDTKKVHIGKYILPPTDIQRMITQGQLGRMVKLPWKSDEDKNGEIQGAFGDGLHNNPTVGNPCPCTRPSASTDISRKIGKLGISCHCQNKVWGPDGDGNRARNITCAHDIGDECLLNEAQSHKRRVSDTGLETIPDKCTLHPRCSVNTKTNDQALNSTRNSEKRLMNATQGALNPNFTKKKQMKDSQQRFVNMDAGPIVSTDTQSYEPAIADLPNHPHHSSKEDLESQVSPNSKVKQFLAIRERASQSFSIRTSPRRSVSAPKVSSPNRRVNGDGLKDHKSPYIATPSQKSTISNMLRNTRYTAKERHGISKNNNARTDREDNSDLKKFFVNIDDLPKCEGDLLEFIPGCNGFELEFLGSSR